MELKDYAEEQGAVNKTMPIADRLAPAIDEIVEARAARVSWTVIAEGLKKLHDIEVSVDGVRKYMIAEYPETR